MQIQLQIEGVVRGHKLPQSLWNLNLRQRCKAAKVNSYLEGLKRTLEIILKSIDNQWSTVWNPIKIDGQQI